MADIYFANQSVPATPASGNGIGWFDSTAKCWAYKDDAGKVYARSTNSAVASQGAGFSSDTYVTNSDLLIPSWGLQAKTAILWIISASKTAAGIATPIYSVRVGSGRSTSDTARLALTAPAQTAVADIGTLYVMLTVRTAGAACVLQGTSWWSHRGTAASSTIGAGFANDGSGHVEGTSASWDASAVNGQYIGLSINGGTSASWTISQCQAECDW